MNGDRRSFGRYVVRAVLAGWRADPWSPIAGAVAVAFALALPLVVGGLVVQLGPRLDALGSDSEVSVFMQPDASADDVVRARSAIEARAAGARPAADHGIPAVVIPVPKAQALAELRQRIGEIGPTALRTNPLPDGFVIRLRGWPSADVERLAQSLRSVARVDLVQLDAEWVRTLGSTVAAAKRVAMVLGVAIVLVLLVTVQAAVRSEVLARREEIELARLIGATDGFVQAPFALRGAAIGAVGAVGGLALSAAVASALAPVLDGPAATAAWTSVPWWTPIALIGGTAALGALGGGLSAHRYLRTLS